MTKVTWRKTERGYTCNEIDGLHLFPDIGGRWKTEIASAPLFSGLTFSTKGEATNFFSRNYQRLTCTPEK